MPLANFQGPGMAGCIAGPIGSTKVLNRVKYGMINLKSGGLFRTLHYSAFMQ